MKDTITLELTGWKGGTVRVSLWGVVKDLEVKPIRKLTEEI